MAQIFLFPGILCYTKKYITNNFCRLGVGKVETATGFICAIHYSRPRKLYIWKYANELWHICWGNPQGICRKSFIPPFKIHFNRPFPSNFQDLYRLSAPLKIYTSRFVGFVRNLIYRLFPHGNSVAQLIRSNGLHLQIGSTKIALIARGYRYENLWRGLLPSLQSEKQGRQQINNSPKPASRKLL
jgi:hypothetical protein